MKFTNARILIAIVLGSILISFQNCSRAVKFSEFGDESFKMDFSSNSSDLLTRTQVIMPSFKTAATDEKIKVLLVIDNSPTMSASQVNLTKNLNSLLAQIKNYNADVKVVSTTLYDNSCANISNCPSQPVFSLTKNTGSMIVGADVYQTESSSLAEKEKQVFKFEKTMSETDKANTITAISNKVISLGTNGVDSESQLGVIASQIDLNSSSFFQKNDKALIFVLTDEDDSYSVSNLIQSKSSYRAYKNDTVGVPGMRPRVPRWSSSAGSCVIRNEIGNVTGSYTAMPSTFETESQCLSYVASANSGNSCTYSGCGYSAYSFYSSVIKLDGMSLTDKCNEFRTSYGKPVTDCISEIVYDSTTVYYTQSSSNFFNWDKSKIDAAKSANTTTNFVLTEVKNQLTNLFGSKYLLSVMANISSQSCALKTAQSSDTFFSQKLAAVLPATNFQVSSICDTADDSSFNKISNLFESIINKDYQVNLASNEIIKKVTVYSGNNRTNLIEGQDFKIENGVFQLLNASISSFDKIEVNIETN